jgi:hypothetical protein
MLHSARAIETAPHGPAEERPFLLWCPEQGGWQTGVWFKGQWMDSITLKNPLAPTHWMETPSDPPMSNLQAGARETLVLGTRLDAVRNSA